MDTDSSRRDGYQCANQHIVDIYMMVDHLKLTESIFFREMNGLQLVIDNLEIVLTFVNHMN